MNAGRRVNAGRGGGRIGKGQNGEEGAKRKDGEEEGKDGMSYMWKRITPSKRMGAGERIGEDTKKC